MSNRTGHWTRATGRTWPSCPSRVSYVRFGRTGEVDLCATENWPGASQTRISSSAVTVAEPVCRPRSPNGGTSTQLINGTATMSYVGPWLPMPPRREETTSALHRRTWVHYRLALVHDDRNKTRDRLTLSPPFSIKRSRKPPPLSVSGYTCLVPKRWVQAPAKDTARSRHRQPGS